MFTAAVAERKPRLRNQMKRLFTAHVQLIYEDQHGEANVSSSVADRSEFWWNPKRPNEPSLWQSKIYLGEAFFNEIIRHPVPLDMNALRALKRSPLGLDLYLWAVYRTFSLAAPMALSWPMLYRQFGVEPSRRQCYGPAVPPRLSPRAQENQDGLAGTGVPHRTRSAAQKARHPGSVSVRAGGSAPHTSWTSPTHKLITPFPGRQRPFRSGLDFIP